MNAIWREHALTAAVAIGSWGLAGALWLTTGKLSFVLLAAPVAWALADAALLRRKDRLANRVSREFPDLIEEGGEGFDGAQAQLLARRARLLGFLPPRLVEFRLAQAPGGAHFLVRAEVCDDVGPIAWRVVRLTPAELQRWQRELA